MTSVRRALGLMVAVELVFLLPSPLYVITGYTVGGGIRGHPAVALLVTATIGAIQLWHSLAATRAERPAGWPYSLAALVVLVYLPMPWWTWNWAAMQWFVIASVLQLVPGRAGALLAAAPLAGTVATAVVDPVVAPTLANGLVEGFYWLVGLGLGGFAVYGSARLVRVLDELHATRAELAEAAVGRERLRVSRDLHDLLGQALSAVSLKGDLALALLHRDPAAARAEIAALTDVARAALRDVRAITSGRHHVSLRTEIDGAVGLLASAGIDAHLDLDAAEPPPAVQPLLAWAVREGVTNVLRHSEATSCTLTVERRDGRVRLEIANDGAHPPGAGGTGLAGLAARARAAGGTAVAEQVGDRFRLVVDVPEETP